MAESELGRKLCTGCPSACCASSSTCKRFVLHYCDTRLCVLPPNHNYCTTVHAVLQDVIRAHARDELGIDMDELANPLQAAGVSSVAFTAGEPFKRLFGPISVSLLVCLPASLPDCLHAAAAVRRLRRDQCRSGTCAAVTGMQAVHS